MIDSVVTYIVSQLNQALKLEYGLSEDMVVMSNLSEKASLVTSDRVVAMLVNIEKESFSPQTMSRSSPGNGQVAKNYRPVNLNLYLMLVANFQGESYSEGLSFISRTIDFFQYNPVFDSNKNRDMPPNIDKLLVDIENLNLRELHSIWTLITGEYMPSILFKVRTVSFDRGIHGVSPVVKGIGSNVKKKGS